MFHKLAFLFVLLISSSAISTAADLYPLPGEQISAAAASLRKSDYRSAAEAASKAPPSGAKAFVMGLAAEKQGDNAAAADQFAVAADKFPLLGDYALFHQAEALHRIGRYAEAATPLQRLLREFPDSVLVRSSMHKLAESYFLSGDFRNGYESYQKFIGKYAAGSDAVVAQYNSAVCLEKSGDPGGAAAIFKSILLKNPGSVQSELAEKDLLRLSATGVELRPLSTEDQLVIAANLYDRQKYQEALDLLYKLPADAIPAGLADKYLLKLAQAQVKKKRFNDAEKSLALVKITAASDLFGESSLLQAKILDKAGRQDEAVSLLTSLADSRPDKPVADRALLEAALIRAGEKKSKEALLLLGRIAEKERSPLRERALWEISWGRYLAGDLRSAADSLRALSTFAGSREKALFWYARTLSAMGDRTGAETTIEMLRKEFPFGFYAQMVDTEATPPSLQPLSAGFAPKSLLPMPAGFDRVKALITLGLTEEARKELSRKRSSPGKDGLPGLARLYLEMDDYNGAYNLLGNQRPRELTKENLHLWGILFPMAFSEKVSEDSRKHKVPEPLVYSIIKAESSFLPTALSPVGALGLMQLMPATAAAMTGKDRTAFDSSILKNPETNVSLGVRHLRDLLTQYKGNVVLAIAAYNAGSGNVNRWRKNFGNLKQEEFIENIPYPETREYVKKVLAATAMYSKLYQLPAIVPDTVEPGIEQPPAREDQELAVIPAATAVN